MTKKKGQDAGISKVRRYLVPLALLLLVIGASVSLFVYRDTVSDLGNWGYLGAFLIGLAANATVIFPMPGLLILFTLGATFNPFLVGLAGAAGGAIGEMSGYVAGHSGKKLIGRNKTMRRAEVWMKRWGAAGIFVFALIPFLPLDIAGLAAGALRYSIWKFLVAAFLGKTLLYVGLTYATAWGWDVINGWFG
jgi:membrane protein DedA with SNARE-associated domain